MENIFNNFDNFLEADQKRLNKIEANQLRQQIIHIENTCGSCNKWMTSDCKREKNHKVTCNESKCNDFQIQQFYINLINERETKAKQLEL